MKLELELEANMYVRTKEGYICRILKLKEEINDDGYLDFNDIGSASIQKKNVIKASHKIEDLLKKGDYVNGYMITDFGDDYYDEELDEYVEGFSIVLGNEEQFYRIPPKDIKTVLTKEQFESMAYKVVEEC